MKEEYIENVPEVGFRHVVTVEASGTKTIHISGQTGESPDLKSQSIEAFANLEKRLAAAGAKPTDVVKMTTYVVNYSEEKAADAFAGMPLVFKDPANAPAATMMGVQSLFYPHLLIEVEATAVISTD